MKAIIGELKSAALVAAICLPVIGLLYLQSRIIHDCGWMALFKGAEWWWLFGYCN